jgi:DNA end-binding protein Ku
MEKGGLITCGRILAVFNTFFPFSYTLRQRTNTSPFICCTTSAALVCKNRYHCPVCNVMVEREDRIRGYEFTKDQYVQFTDAELESLETESSNNIELKEFIPLSKFDPVYFENAYYVGAGEGGEKPYWLLADALVKSDRAAIAQLVTRGKEQLVLIRPMKTALSCTACITRMKCETLPTLPKGRTRSYQIRKSSWEPT